MIALEIFLYKTKLYYSFDFYKAKFCFIKSIFDRRKTVSWPSYLQFFDNDSADHLGTFELAHALARRQCLYSVG